MVLKLPADVGQWPAWSITDAGHLFTNVWKSYSFAVGGSRYTLNDIEHDVLRPLGEPRIHVAINCAFRSCPVLARVPYQTAMLNAQLEAASRIFANSPDQLRLDGEVMRVNPILDWFGDDFAPLGGVRAFLSAHVARGSIATYLAGGKPLRFFDYDWRLNLAGRAP